MNTQLATLAILAHYNRWLHLRFVKLLWFLFPGFWHFTVGLTSNLRF